MIRLPDVVLVVIPVRDEERLLGRCLHAARSAARPLRRSGIRVRVVTVLDRCTDSSGEIAHRMRGPDDLVVEVSVGQVGCARDVGVRAGLDGVVASRPPWVVFTDADSAVHPCWLVDHVRLSVQGPDCIAGGVALLDHQGRDLAARWLAHVRRSRDRPRIYGANLGVRADALQEIGGVPHRDVGEDQEIWDLLGRAGRPRTARPGLTVGTSARAQGRAPGGFHRFLTGLQL